MDAGRLRHRVDFQRRVNNQDPVTGEIAPQWVNLFTSVPAAIEPLNGKEFIAANAVQSEITTRITVRYRAGISATQRIKHGAKIYNVYGALPDKDSGLTWLTIPCSVGTDLG